MESSWEQFEVWSLAVDASLELGGWCLVFLPRRAKARQRGGGRGAKSDLQKGMSPRVCICCGETMSKNGNALSSNPNLCACCSSLSVGTDEPEPEPSAQDPSVASETLGEMTE